MDVSGFAVANQVGRAADGVANHTREPGRERFVDDQAPGLGEIAGQREAIGEGIRLAELTLIHEAEHFQGDAQPRGFCTHLTFERAGPDNHERRAGRKPRQRPHDVDRPLGAHQLADKQRDERVGIDVPPPARGGADIGIAIGRGGGGEALVVNRVRYVEDAVDGHAVTLQILLHTNARREKAVELPQQEARLESPQRPLPAARSAEQMRVAAIQRRHAQPPAGDQRPDQGQRIPARDQDDVRARRGDRSADLRHVEAGERSAVDAIVGLRRTYGDRPVPVGERHVPFERAIEPDALLFRCRLRRVHHG